VQGGSPHVRDDRLAPDAPEGRLVEREVVLAIAGSILVVIALALYSVAVWTMEL
jgi:hypothetical protein